MKKIYLLLIIILSFTNFSNAKDLILDILNTPGKTNQDQKWFFITDRVILS